jgi:putative endonuclease
MSFWAYMLHCNAGRLYVGHTDDLEARMGQHLSGSVRGFSDSYLPVKLVWSSEYSTRYEALAAERQIKGWSRAKKLALIRDDWSEIGRLAKSRTGLRQAQPERTIK